MKRLIIAIILMTVLVTVCGVSTWNLYLQKEQLAAQVEELRILVLENVPRMELKAKAEELLAEWKQEEKIMVIYVRHDSLDSITRVAASLPALIHYEDYASFLSQLDVMSACLEDLWKSNLPNYRNLL